jgi:hypothetical protein
VPFLMAVEALDVLPFAFLLLGLGGQRFVLGLLPKLARLVLINN